MDTKIWLVTGCSTGLGRTFIPAILARGDKAIATARDVATLRDFDSTHGVKILQLDVTAKQDVLTEKVKEATALFGRIDVLVNNAGYVASGIWEELNHEETVHQFDTNVFGALNLTRAVLPQMRARRSGTILFMSSISGWLGVGGGGPYSSSKFAIEGAAECLQKETIHLGIETFLVVLGQFRTDILASKKRKAIRQNAFADYDSISEAMAERHIQTDGKQPGDPDLAVRRILDAVKREGEMEGKKALPLRLILGSDAVSVVRAKCMETLDLVQEYEKFSRSTDYQEVVGVPVYE